MRFVCDRVKRAGNIKKHGIDLIQASQVFTDPFALSAYDSGHSMEEDRYTILGKMNNELLIFVSYTLRQEHVRIISARTAKAREVKKYGEQ